MTEINTTFAYELPYGAQVRSDGSVRFRVWAPTQPSMAVSLPGVDESVPMEPDGDGWFKLETNKIAVGGSYLLELPDGMRVPDPASRCQETDVDGPSVVIDPRRYQWRNGAWAGRPWEEVVLYELHVGTVTPEGTFEGLRKRLDHFVDIGITAIELMPVADFSGNRGWGYDGVLPYSPERSYGTPDELKRLIDEAHGKGLMVFLDVVYNHFGPLGNYLPSYAGLFFDENRKTPWGDSIDFTQQPVRDFFAENALFWLEEYRFDGLRFDAVDHIIDPSDDHFLEEMARRVRGRITDRHVHLVLENDNNSAKLLERDQDLTPVLFNAQWNDDYHHVAHTQVTGEGDGYYQDYREDRLTKFGKALSSGFVYQGDVSEFRQGKRRGEPSGHLPPTAFVNFIQNHDQVGNRAYGERLTDIADSGAVAAALELLLLAPQIPLLFMGEEWGETRPFCFFCDFHDELADAVREGRRNEFAKFERFSSPSARESIPDPNSLSTFEACKLDWNKAQDGEHAERMALVSRLLHLRAERIVPLLKRIGGSAGAVEMLDGHVMKCTWQFDGGALIVTANLQSETAAMPSIEGEILHGAVGGDGGGSLPGWTVVWSLQEHSTA
ncbi:maltooligosyltrehalose trehalohydrolase [Rhodoligotrophos appendicifer]|uniref:malto-oligosyltrehalose trehalohydrolase n=1 Tax=Rhodoligotrophos appendicifer TaxID=987056 RepID=UPI001186F3C7|nr:malto-oligosyltrehalose trehalohydrolase [Rhodoligotrophos appendicifer]